jgi:hypothetical protein
MDRRLTAAGVMALPMCRRDIADYLGLSLETVSRALSYPHGKGILGFLGQTQRQIVLLDRERWPNWTVGRGPVASRRSSAPLALFFSGLSNIRVFALTLSLVGMRRPDDGRERLFAVQTGSDR